MKLNLTLKWVASTAHSSLNTVLLTLVIGLSLVACSSGEQSPVDSRAQQIAAKITDWQTREAGCQNTTEISNGLTDYQEVYNALQSILESASSIHPKREAEDYWKTSCEAAADGYGDCEDICAYWYAIIRDRGVLPDRNVSFMWIQFTRDDASRGGHMVLQVQTDGATLYINNGCLVNHLNYRDMVIIAEYDLWSHWM